MKGDFVNPDGFQAAMGTAYRQGKVVCKILRIIPFFMMTVEIAPGVVTWTPIYNEQWVWFFHMN